MCVCVLPLDLHELLYRYTGLFQPLKMASNIGKEDLYVDGGTLCNYPLHAYDGKCAVLILDNRVTLTGMRTGKILDTAIQRLHHIYFILLNLLAVCYGGAHQTLGMGSG